MPKRRIVISNNDDLKNPFYGGGGALAVHEIAKRLIKEFDITVYTSRYPNSEDEVIDGIHYKRIGLSIHPLLNQLIFSVSLPYYVKTVNFDVWLEVFTPPFSVNCLQLFTRKPVIGVTQFLSAKEMQMKYGIPFEIFEKMGLKTYKYFVALTDSIKDKIKKINTHAEIRTIPNGLERRLIEYTHKEKSRYEYILFIGRIDIFQKGLDTLLEAYAQVKDKIPYKLHIAGSGNPDEESRLGELIRQYQLNDQVTSVGRVSGQKKDNECENALFTIVPSRFETFGITILESFCYEKATIINDIDDLKWVPRDCAIWFKRDDPSDLAKKIIYMCNNKDVRISLQLQGKRHVRTYDWDGISTQYIHFINHTLHESSKKR